VALPSVSDFERVAASVGDRYQVEREVGRGGMATVYLAQDRKHQRPVALKVLHPHLAANLGPERFLREIQIAASLQHPHIVPLYDSGQAEGFLYYVMPYIDGESLRHRMVRDTTLPVEDALRITRSIASALDYAHNRQVVHRDIKPENVLLHHGEAMVTDFGIAKALTAAAADNLTQTGTSMGTPAYMSPEQSAGETNLDGRSDQYSLACVLYEMLSGRTPFTGPNGQAIIARSFTEPVPPLVAPRERVPAFVDRAVVRALSKAPADRFGSAAAFSHALGSVGGVSTPPGNTTASMRIPEAQSAKSVAVLPFVNMSADAENEYFSDGIAEEIINALTKVRSLRVASRTSTFALKGKNLDARTIGDQLHVSTVLEGSVRKAGNRLRVTAQLVNMADGYQLWSERYDREMEDVFAIQDEIAGSIVHALQVVLSEGEKKAIENAPRADVEAYDYYLRGRQFMHQLRRTGIQYARRMFERAIEIDAGFVKAYAGAADCCCLMYMLWDGTNANLEGADTYSRKALGLGPDVAEAHASRGLALTLSQHYAEAEREFETAIRLDPQLFDAHYFASRTAFLQGKNQEAVEFLDAAARVRPDEYQPYFLQAMPLRKLGRQADAEAAMREGIAKAERHIELNPDDARALYLGAGGLVQIGQAARALEWARRSLALDPEDSAVLYNVACVYALGGKNEDALTCLEKAVQNGFGHRSWLENDSDFNSIRQEPRFQALLKKM
jgi:serine/threonine protein kinase/tetratricopeptide (TPR) repeat protein